MMVALDHVAMSLRPPAALRSMQATAKRHFWGNTCDSRSALESECFTAEACVEKGRSSSELTAPLLDPQTLTLVAFRGPAAVGFLQCHVRRNHMFVFNVCVIPSQRGQGVCPRLFAALRQLVNGPLALTVFFPMRNDASATSIAYEVSHERCTKLQKMYRNLGFSVVKVQGSKILMRSPANYLRGRTHSMDADFTLRKLL